jgi:hypothetical protein
MPPPSLSRTTSVARTPCRWAASGPPGLAEREIPHSPMVGQLPLRRRQDRTKPSARSPRSSPDPNRRRGRRPEPVEVTDREAVAGIERRAGRKDGSQRRSRALQPAPVSANTVQRAHRAAAPLRRQRASQAGSVDRRAASAIAPRTARGAPPPPARRLPTDRSGTIAREHDLRRRGLADSSGLRRGEHAEPHDEVGDVLRRNPGTRSSASSVDQTSPSAGVASWTPPRRARVRRCVAPAPPGEPAARDQVVQRTAYDGSRRALASNGTTPRRQPDRARLARVDAGHATVCSAARSRSVASTESADRRRARATVRRERSGTGPADGPQAAASAGGSVRAARSASGAVSCSASSTNQRACEPNRRSWSIVCGRRSRAAPPAGRR